MGLLNILLKALIPAIFDYFKRRSIKKAETKYVDRLKLMVQFRNVMGQIANLTFVDRVLLLNGKNGGGLPTAGHKYTVMAVDGWTTLPHHTDVLKLYGHDIQVDNHYATMLVNMIDAGVYTNVTSEMPIRSLLRGMYEVEGVSSSLVFFLRVDSINNQLEYISLGRYSGTFNDIQIAAIRPMVAWLKAIVTSH